MGLLSTVLGASTAALLLSAPCLAAALLLTRWTLLSGVPSPARLSPVLPPAAGLARWRLPAAKLAALLTLRRLLALRRPLLALRCLLALRRLLTPR